MDDHGLLEPGVRRGAAVADDRALVRAMLEVEVAWLRAMARVGAIESVEAETVAEAATGWQADLATLGVDTEASGNPVVPLVRDLRASITDAETAALVHRGLTSQDVLDTALILLARDALTRVHRDLEGVVRSLAALTAQHRDAVMVGRTLTQYAVPITFGLKAARWLSGVLDASDSIDSVVGQLPVQCGGAAGTLALTGELTTDPVAVARAFADELDLAWPGLPWHTSRAPVTRVAAALVGACDVMGRIGSDVAFLSRPEISEVREGEHAGRGGSSTMPNKRNPVLSVLVRSAGLQAPLLGAQLHLAAAQAVDERPDGAWHSEWPALRRLLVLSVTTASQTAELVSGLEVDTEAMRTRAFAAADELLAERGVGSADPTTYLGATAAFVDVVLERALDGRQDHG